jgi:AbrB family looped-hinge helix DNA binding protein
VAKVTSKFQVTIPKALAERFGIQPGHEVQWAGAGESIRLTPKSAGKNQPDVRERLELFDQATARHSGRQRKRVTKKPRSRGWTREELYVRGRSR